MTQYFEDLQTGSTIEAAEYRVGAEEIVAFAERYDPRPFHLDARAAEQSVFGGLVASGIHSIAIWNRLRFDAEAGLAMMAGLGLDELRYHRPVRPGDCLSLRAECVEKRYSQNDANRGIMRFRHQLVNQDGDAVMTCIVTLLVAARGPATEP